MSAPTGRLLILNVDRDNDLGIKAGVKSPVIGREAVLEAARKLIMSDPEDADANAMFAAVKLYDELSGKWGDALEVVTITGEPGGGMRADIKMAQELESVLSVFKPSECVIISDGPVEQSTLSIVSSRVKITSVRYVVVKQSQSIEQTWFIMARYLRMAITEPHYAKYLLGVPGGIFIVIGVLYLLGLLNIPILLTMLGIILVLRGFRVDEAIGELAKRIYGITSRPLTMQIKIFSTIASIIILIAGLSFGFGATARFVSENLPNAPPLSDQPGFWLERLGLLIGIFLSNSVDLLLVAALLSTAYNVFYYLYFRSPKVWRMSQAAIFFVFLWALLRVLGDFLRSGESFFLIQLVLISAVGFATLATSLILIRTIRARFSDHFRRR